MELRAGAVPVEKVRAGKGNYRLLAKKAKSWEEEKGVSKMLSRDWP